MAANTDIYTTQLHIHIKKQDVYTTKNRIKMKKTGITEKLKAIELNVLVEIPAQECEYMAIRSLCHRIGGKWDVKKNGLVTYVKRLEL